MAEEGAPAAAAMPETTTMAGATMITVSPWMTAAVVAAYATRALWVKLRSATGKQKLLKNCQDKPLGREEDGNDSDPEAESQDECEAVAGAAPVVKQDQMLKHVQLDAGPLMRSIEL